MKRKPRKVFDIALRDGLWTRCKGYCEKCGNPLHPDSWAWHHRRLKKHGGADEMSNGMALHHGCHNLNTGSVHLDPARSYENGWLVESWKDWRTCPITLPDGSRVMLDNEGNYNLMKEGENET